MSSAISTPVEAGIEARHGRGCSGAPCSCSPSYRASVYDRAAGKKVRATFSTVRDARSWRRTTAGKQETGSTITPSTITVRDASAAWLDGAEAGTVRDRSGRPYKPSTLRGYRADLERFVYPDLGAARLSDLRRADVQKWLDRLAGELDPATGEPVRSGQKARNVLTALQRVIRWNVSRGSLANADAVAGLEKPEGSKRRERIADPAETAELLAALPLEERALWATAAYSGLRRGELRGLRWEDVDLAGGRIHVRRSWDDYAGEVTPKSSAGTRTVPLMGILRDELIEHKTRTGRDGSAFVFGRTATEPFTATAVRKRALRAWADANVERAEQELELLEPIGLHELRHSFASLAIAAGVNAKTLSTYMGHSSITITLDRYGHLFEGHEAEAAELLDAYARRADTGSRIAALDDDDRLDG